MALSALPDRPEIEPVLAKAKELVRWISTQLDDLIISGEDRHKIPGLMFDVSIEHYFAIVHLVDARICAGAYALVRSEFETYVRGLWLHYCATDEQISRFLDRDELPKTGALVTALEAMEGFEDKILSGIMEQAWRGMNGYTHSGTHQLARRMKQGSIEPNYEAEEILEVLRFSGTIAQMALAEIGQMAGKADLVAELQSRLGPVEPGKAV